MEVESHIAVVSGSGSSATSGQCTQQFHGRELLLLNRLQTEPELFESWKANMLNVDCEFDCAEVPSKLWFMTVALDGNKDRLLYFIQEQIHLSMQPDMRMLLTESLLARYLNAHAFTELHLDGIFKYGDDNTLPLEIFKCLSVRRLSLKYNYLDRIPADIGRLSKLEYLALTSNKLQNKSLPFTLTFCGHLHTLLLDNNLLDALPGFLLRMPSLCTVHRHGNHNYFKSTFMWYHTDFNERILRVQGTAEPPSTPPSPLRRPRPLQFWAAKAIAGSKSNFFESPLVATRLRDYIADVYSTFNVCGYCNKAVLTHLSGYKVITFKNPYLGNTCVPFQHWACSIECATNLEVPAREEQIAAARELDRQYDTYIRECHRLYRASTDRSAARALICANRRRRHQHHQSHDYQTTGNVVESAPSLCDSVSTASQVDGEDRCPSPTSGTSCFGGCRLACCIS